jgi:hypothetical protein
MTLPIKIECTCGQHYSFDVEPVNGRLPWPVACPTCGADGTEVANEAITLTLAAEPEVAVAAPVAQAAPMAVATHPGGSLRVATASHAPAAAAAAPAAAPSLRVSGAAHSAAAPSETISYRPKPGRLPGQMDRAQAEQEARAKVSWGDSQEQVLSHLMIQGFSLEEASGIVNELFEERAAEVRKKGYTNLAIGLFLIALPFGMWFYTLHLQMPPGRLFVLTCLIGLGGVVVLFRGIFMVVAPKSQRGDVAEQ